MVDNIIYPTVIRCNENVIGALSSQKGYEKSLETKILWVVHPQTERLLPYRGSPRFISLEKKAGWFEAELGKEALPTPYEWVLSDTEVEKGERSSKDFSLQILETLEKVVCNRKNNPAPGSYTTHLFEKGTDKIRKKMGEEAVELLLARSGDEIIHESADLIYHLLVLLAEEKISLKLVMDELNHRNR